MIQNSPNTAPERAGLGTDDPERAQQLSKLVKRGHLSACWDCLDWARKQLQGFSWGELLANKARMTVYHLSLVSGTHLREDETCYYHYPSFVECFRRLILGNMQLW